MADSRGQQVYLPEGNWHEPPSKSSSIMTPSSQTPSGLPSAPFFASGALQIVDHLTLQVLYVGVSLDVYGLGFATRFAI